MRATTTTTTMKTREQQQASNNNRASERAMTNTQAFRLMPCGRCRARIALCCVRDRFLLYWRPRRSARRERESWWLGRVGRVGRVVVVVQARQARRQALAGTGRTFANRVALVSAAGYGWFGTGALPSVAVAVAVVVAVVAAVVDGGDGDGATAAAAAGTLARRSRTCPNPTGSCRTAAFGRCRPAAWATCPTTCCQGSRSRHRRHRCHSAWCHRHRHTRQSLQRQRQRQQPRRHSRRLPIRLRHRTNRRSQSRVPSCTSPNRTTCRVRARRSSPVSTETVPHQRRQFRCHVRLFQTSCPTTTTVRRAAHCWPHPLAGCHERASSSSAARQNRATAPRTSRRSMAFQRRRPTCHRGCDRPWETGSSTRHCHRGRRGRRGSTTSHCRPRSLRRPKHSCASC